MSARDPRLLFVVVLAFQSSSGQIQARDPFQATRARMVEEVLIAEGIKDPRVIKSMQQTMRHEFVPIAKRRLSYFDMAIPIGRAQTISPPYVVAYMTQMLELKAEDTVLEIGTGSGYQAAVLSPLVKDVYTIEIVETLGRRAAATLRRLKYKNVHSRIGDGFKGWPSKAPFDKIIVTCSPENVPLPLVEQLKEGGRMIVPLGERYQQSLYLFTKKDGKLISEALVPTMFVPMTGRAEAERKVKPDPLNPKLINNSFEKYDKKSGRVKNWYYQRQLTVETADDAPEGDRYLTFNNREPSRDAQALQAFPIDGRKIRGLKISCSVKCSGVRSGLARQEIAGVTVTFFDKDRQTVGHVSIGNWRGTFDWSDFNTQIKTPASAREALLRIGLNGATGQASFDRVSIEAIKR